MAQTAKLDLPGTEEDLQIKRFFTTEGIAPLRRDRVGAARRRHPELPDRRGRVRAEGRRVPQGLVPERHQHRGAEVLPRHPRHPSTVSTSVKQMIDRVVDRYHEEGLERGYFEDDGRGAAYSRTS